MWAKFGEMDILRQETRPGRGKRVAGVVPGWEGSAGTARCLLPLAGSAGGTGQAASPGSGPALPVLQACLEPRCAARRLLLAFPTTRTEQTKPLGPVTPCWSHCPHLSYS